MGLTFTDLTGVTGVGLAVPGATPGQAVGVGPDGTGVPVGLKPGKALKS